MLAATRAFGLRAPAVARPATTRLALVAPAVRPLEQASYLGGSLVGSSVSSAPSRGSLVVMAGMACTISGKGSNKKRRTTSGFRARLATPSGQKVLKARRKKGRHSLAPASEKKSGGKK